MKTAIVVCTLLAVVTDAHAGRRCDNHVPYLAAFAGAASAATIASNLISLSTNHPEKGHCLLGVGFGALAAGLGGSMLVSDSRCAGATEYPFAAVVTAVGVTAFVVGIVKGNVENTRARVVVESAPAVVGGGVEWRAVLMVSL